MKLIIVFNRDGWPGRLTKFFTGCTAYHVGWADEHHFYDMNLLRRRRLWPCYDESMLISVDVPQVSKEYLEAKLSTDDSTYGFVDYLLFALRPIYHLFGKSTRNAGGVICSEMVNIDLWACSVKTPWPLDSEPPSPCDIVKWIGPDLTTAV